MSYVIGTAGHVDHGKSTLIRRLTGIDPDRLAEEKRRGLTIDLGFASMRLPSGTLVGIVDVPGHARFIHNMLAGVHGLDAVLLVVAADEGVMPQTREHLGIVDVLDIRRGLVALTKVDLVDDEWRQMVVDDIRQVLGRTSLGGAPIVPVSSVTGEGVDELVARLDVLLDGTPRRADVGRPRLPVDRVFTIGGFGTVVTGTLVDGRLHAGAEMELQPSRRRVRLRGLQQHGNDVQEAEPGSRAAANLGGVEKSEVARGEVLVLPGSLVASRRFDASTRVLRDAPGPLRHGAELLLHTGTAEVGCRAIVLGQDEIEPGARGWVQLYLARPIAVVAGDRLVLRRPSPSSTVAGGTVVDVAPRRHRRLDPDVVASLVRRAEGGALQEELRKHPRGITERDLERLVPLDGAAPAKLDAHRAGQLLFAPQAWADLSRRAVELLAAHHRAHPLRPGMPREELASRLRLGPGVLAALAADGVLAERGAEVALPTHRPTLEAADEERADRLLDLLGAEPYAPPSLAEAVRQAGADMELVRALAGRGRLVRLSEDVAFTRDAYDRALDATRTLVAEDGSVSVSTLRDRLGASRRPTLALLEHLDRERVTRRVGDVRVLR